VARRFVVALSLAALLAPGAARAAGDPSVAALQTALYRKGLYRETVDGFFGPATQAAIRALQRRAAMRPDGLPGPRTRRLLGRLGAPSIGRRVLVAGLEGWDVAALQFMLAWHGFPSGPFDGALGPRTDIALRRFQRWAGLGVDGRAGPATLAALRQPPAPCPVSFAYPLAGRLTSPFGPRGDAFHEGVDLAAPTGTVVGAARSGRVTWAGYRAGGWGNLVVVNHGGGVRSLYAHLSRISVRVGRWVEQGQTLGLVGATGDATGPHLHFEVRFHGAAVDPLPVLH
jgi:peptidoglycan hydrolase-like protein with peptidoglycan-binding domain